MAGREDLGGVVAVITGANSGIGFETARALVSKGAHVVLACRSEDKARDAERALTAAGGRGTTEICALDLADLGSVREAAEQLRRRCNKIDLLINNAGVMGIPLRRTADGFEMQLGTNHLGHFALTGRVLDRVLAAPAGRVVTVSSVAHWGGVIRFHDPNWERSYQRWLAYGQSKLANLLFTWELSRRLEASGARAIAVACHPGASATNLQYVAADMENARLKRRVWELGNRTVAQSAADGAKPTLFAALDDEVAPGGYYGPDGPFELRGEPKRAGRARRAKDPDAARRLWALSEELTGVRYELAG